ncbi:hypothetical protein GCM10022381_24970 [Leifsonia kafniensis]|uniref:DUF11 domain-containing protein n=1 Tax=Leifsonia kafniensis TaxID=475957 RepID=A0ABP7KM03_9MICO
MSVALALTLLAGTFVSVGLVTSGQQTQAATARVPGKLIADGTLPKAFAEGPGQAFVAQGGGANTLLHEVQVKSGTGTTAGNMVFSAGSGPFAPYGLNALAFDQDNMLMYAMQLGSKFMYRIGDDGEYQKVKLPFPAGFDPSTTSWFTGAWGEGAYFIRDSARNYFYKITDLLSASPTITTVPMTGGAVPSVRDLSYKGGYLWGFDATGGAKIYRINAATGESKSFIVPKIGNTPVDFGAQWFLGNGNLVVSKNGDSTSPYYQIHNDGTLESPVFSVLSTTTGQSSTNNDGASYLGVPIDLGVVKSASTLYAGNGTLTYSMTVTNHNPTYASSGHQLIDTLPAALLNPKLINSPNCRIVASNVTCSGGILEPGASVTYTVTGSTKNVVVAACITNTARVVGNEADPNPGNDESTANPCAKDAPEGFTVEKTAEVTQQPGTTVDSTVPGGAVKYRITVTNTNLTAYTAIKPASFTDDLAAVLDDATYRAGSATSGAVYNNAAKTLTWSGPLAIDESVVIEYWVDVKSTGISDYMLTNVVKPGAEGRCVNACMTATPVSSYIVSKTADKAVVAAGDTVRYTVEATNIGQVAYTDASFLDDLSDVTTNATYNNDAAFVPEGSQTDADAGTLGYAPSELSWSGALAVGETKSFSYTVTAKDDANGTLINVVAPTTVTGSCLTAASCRVEIPISGYTVVKSVDKDKAAPGDTVTYTVTVANTGAADLAGLSFDDDLTGVLDNATFDGASTSSIGAATYDATAKKLTWTGGLLIGQSATVTYSVVVKPEITGTYTLTNVVCWTETERVCDSTETLLPGRTLVKSVDKAQAAPGDTVTYAVTVTNTGQTDLLASSFTDDLTGVLGNATFDGASVSTIGAATYNATTKKLTWTGDLLVGQSATVTYSVVVKPTITGTFTLINVVCWTDSPLICDSELTKLPGRTLVKSVDKATAAAGDTVTYMVAVTNTGQTDLLASSFNDDLTGVLGNATFDGASVSTIGAATYNATTKKLTWTGDLLVGQSATVTYSVVVKPTITGTFTLTNVVCWTDSPLICDSELTKLPGRTLDKAVDKTTAASGDTVTYTVTVTNTGQTDLLASSFNDDLTGVLGNATFDGVSTSTRGAASYNATTKKLTWTGNLLVGQSATVTYSVVVKPTITGTFTLTNVVCWTDSPLICDSETTKLPGRTLVKSVDKAIAVAGETVTYTVTVTNTGQTDLLASSFTDDLTGVLGNATFDGASASTIGAATYNATTKKLTWTGDLLVGQSATVTYSVVVKPTITGTFTLTNVVCWTDSPLICDSELTKLPGRTLVKSVDKATAVAGETVTYSVTVTNTGQTDLLASSVTDDLTGVLGNATFDGVSSSTRGAATYDATTKKLTWSGDLLVGQSATVIYSVVVKAIITGSFTLTNVVCWTDSPLICDSELTKLPGRTLDKAVNKTTAAAGDTVMYTVTVTNTGQTDLLASSFTDDLTGVLGNATFDGASSSTRGGASYNATTKKLTWLGDLHVGQSAIVTYVVTVKANIAGTFALTNVVCWTDSPLICDTELTKLPGRTLLKSVDKSTAVAGDTVTYTVTVANTGQTDLLASSFNDDLTGVLGNATFDGASVSTIGAAAYNATTKKLTWTGDLLVGQSATVTYSVVVKANIAGTFTLTNVVCWTDSPLICDSELTKLPGRTLVKSVDKATAASGDTVTYTVTVTNTGQTDLLASSVTDDLTGVLGNATFDGVSTSTRGAASYDATTKKLTWTGDLLVGQSATLTYLVKVKADIAGTFTLTNVVCWTDSPLICDTELTKLPGRTLAKTVDKAQAVAGDTVTYTVTVTNTGQTDLLASSFTDDLAGVLGNASFDGKSVSTRGAASYNATSKKLTWTGNLLVGQSATVTYSVLVKANIAGTFALTNVVCWTDSPLICDSELTKLPGRTLEKAVDKSTAAAGDAVTYTVTVTNTGRTDLLASSFTDDLTGVLGNATFDGASLSTIGAATYDATTKKLTWTGDLLVGQSATLTYSVVVKASIAGTFILTNVVCWTDSPLICDTELTKLPGRTLDKAVDKTKAASGDTVTYTLTVTNTGQTDLLASSVTDDLTGVLGNATFAGKSLSTRGAASYNVASKKLTWLGDLLVGQSATVTYSVVVKPKITGTFTLTNVVCWTDAPLVCDSTLTPIPARTLDKTVDKSTAVSGDTVTYTVTVTNTGQTDLLASSFIDDLAGVLGNATFDGTSVSTIGSASFEAASQKLTWTGDLLIGQSATVSYSVVVKPAISGTFTLKNVVCWTDAPLSCDTELTKLPGHTIVKSADKETAAPGDTVNYTVTVTNTGQVDLTELTFADDMTEVLDDATFDGVVTSTSGAASFDSTTKTLSWAGDLAVGTSAVVTYSVVVDDPILGNHILKNVVCWTDTTLICQDHTIRIPAYTVVKAADKTAAAPGDTVTYSVTVTNTGETDLTGLTFADDMSGVLDDATFDGVATSTIGEATYEATSKTLSWLGDLPLGASAVVTYSVVVDNPILGDHILKNVVCWTDADLICDEVLVPIPAYLVTKVADKSTAAPGDTVTYTVTVTNTGETDLTGLTFADDMSGVLDDATFDGVIDATIGVAGFEKKAQSLNWTGDLLIGEASVVTYSVVVDKPITGDHILKNVVCWTDTELVCADNEVKLPGYVVKKTSDKTSVKPGDTVTYTITVTNTGQADLTDAAFTDDLSNVLKNADYNNDATGGASYADSMLSWSVPLAVGAKLEVKYSLTVKAKAAGTLKNVVVTPPLSNCGVGSKDADCRVDVPITPPLAETGVQLGGALALALLTLASGCGLVAIRRRRTTEAK